MSPSTARPLPSLRARRADAPTPGPTSLSVAHAGSRAACSPPVRLGHLGRTVDVVSGVHVRPGQRCSETPPGGTAPGDTPWLQTASALRALKSERAVVLPMARTGFNSLKVRVLPGPYRLAVLRQVTFPLFQKLPGSISPGFKKLQTGPASTPRSTAPEWMDLVARCDMVLAGGAVQLCPLWTR